MCSKYAPVGIWVDIKNISINNYYSAGRVGISDCIANEDICDMGRGQFLAKIPSPYEESEG